MQAITLAPTQQRSLEETRTTLIETARRKFGSLPPSLIVEHVLGSDAGADFAVREAALEALQRRFRFAERDGLTIATRPAGGRVLGEYTTSRIASAGQRANGRAKNARFGKRRGRARNGGKAGSRTPSGGNELRPYTSWVESLNPLTASCDCADYLKSSLGLCKHLLVVLEEIFESPKRLAQAAKEGCAGRSTLRLSWDPRLALSGKLDRLSGLRLEESASAVRRLTSSGSRPGTELLSRIRERFRDGVLGASACSRLEDRRELLVALDDGLRARPGGRRLLDATPAARALVTDELERAERLTRNTKSLLEMSSELKTLRRSLYAYQREGVERFLGSGRLLLADDMGLGKTTQAIAACHALYEVGKVNRGLVIVPASLKPQWLREWQETTRVPAAIVEGTVEERERIYRELRSGFLIMNYEQLLRDFEAVHAAEPDMVVLDEAQRIKNYATKSAAYVKALEPEYRLVLTGTPMENRLEELASILDWVDDVALAPKWRLVPWYTAWQGDGSKTGKAGARNLDTLRARLEPCVLRRVRKDVLAQLPTRTDTRVPAQMTPQQAEEHDALNQPIIALVAASKRRPLTQAQFLRLMALLTQQRIISNGLGQLNFEEVWPAYAKAQPDAALLEGLFAPKLFELRRLIEDLVLAQERKVVVFSQWRRMLRLSEWSVRDVLGDAGRRAAFFTGAETPSQRTRSIVDFHDDPRVSVMFLSDAGGVGLNLQRAASACINLELPWNPAVLEQRIGRIYRLGQKQPIDVFNLVSEYGIESRIADLIGAKQALFAGLFDGTNDEIRFDATASFLTRVERLVDPGRLPEAPRKPDTLEDGAEDDEPASFPNEAAIADALPQATDPPLITAANGQGEPTANGKGSGAALFEGLRVERTADGGVRIEAAPRAAETLVALFEGMAKLVAAAGPRR